MKSMNTARTVMISLSEEQQKHLMPLLGKAATGILNLPEDRVGSIVVETMGRLTADSALSGWTVNKFLLEEIREFAADPDRYERRTQDTNYGVLAMTAPPGSLDPSPDILAYTRPQNVPTKALPQDEWWHFAQELNGYDVAERIGWDAGVLANELQAEYWRQGRWSGTVLDLRITLFHVARSLYHQGIGLEDAGEERQVAVARLLQAIRERRAAQHMPFTTRG